MNATTDLPNTVSDTLSLKQIASNFPTSEARAFLLMPTLTLEARQQELLAWHKWAQHS